MEGESALGREKRGKNGGRRKGEERKALRSESRRRKKGLAGAGTEGQEEMYRQKIVYFQDSQRKDGGGGRKLRGFGLAKKEAFFFERGHPSPAEEEGCIKRIKGGRRGSIFIILFPSFHLLLFDFLFCEGEY